MSQYDVLLSTNESTVVSEYSEPYGKRSEGYQSEAALERELIRLLQEQGYAYADMHTSEEMIANLRARLEILNDYHFSDTEWEAFFRDAVCGAKEGIEEKTRKIQEDYIQILKKDDGTTKNIRLLDKEDIHKNYLQVIHQVEEKGGNYENRYDVTILVNGLPLVHVELKRRGVPLKEAFNQIARYQRDSFWAGSGLYEYVQIFVISNGTNTKYYSNTTRFSAVKERSGRKKSPRKTSHSFEFTSYWADAKNKTLPDLTDFTRTFFVKHTLLHILTKYCVFTSENMLMVMRPYQIAAAERILNRILTSSNYKKEGTTAAGGYIWHTTGSGKTLTSFKTAQLASHMEGIDKVLFVVDRKDLDYQTMKEYDRFEKGAANGNRNTKTLTRQLEDRDERGHPLTYRIIVTTIQKLDQFIKKHDHHDVYQKHMVMIFDECHRSQFGDMRQAIVKKFKKYHIFGFTGTPIFKDNAGSGGSYDLKTTEQVFGDRLHTYTIVDAIHDRNVLPFRIDYINTVRRKQGVEDRKVEGIDTEEILSSPQRIRDVTKYILEHFDTKTRRNGGFYSFNKLINIGNVAKNTEQERKARAKLNGFNSIFAVSSIETAKRYYREFCRQMEENPKKRLKIAMIYSYAANEEMGDSGEDGFLSDENSDSTEGLDMSSRDFLETAIEDYNKEFGTAYDTSGEKFSNYYKDVSLRMKNREIDLLIVVNMFLTGFDATTLNTLWVDKNLRMHGLIQAFSRTNRILNSVKTYGNIVCFRNLQEETDRAIGLFGDREARGIVLLKSYGDYYRGYEEKGRHQKGYEELTADLLCLYPLDQELTGEKEKKEFIALFGKILRLRNILASFDEFAGQEIVAPIAFQDYMSRYNDLYDEFRREDPEKVSIHDDVVFEMELVKQIEVNIDYILELVKKYHDSNCEDKDILIAIDKAISSSRELRSKKELIDQFVATINVDSRIETDWENFVEKQKEEETKALIAEEKLEEKQLRLFLDRAFQEGEVKTTGTAVDQFLPKMSRFDGSARADKKRTVIERIRRFFEKYFGLP